MNYNQELSDKIENSDLYKDYLSQREKAPEKIRDPKINNIISLKDEKINEFVSEMFKGTEYTAKNNCVYYVVSSETKKLLCNFIAWIMAEITIDDGLEIRKTFKIAGKHKNGYDLSIIDVSETDFSSMNWIIKQWGARCILEPTQSVKDRLRHCIQRISKNIKTESVFGYTGWKYHKDKWVYLYSGGAIGAKDINVKLDGRLQKYRLPTEPKDIPNKLQDIFNTLEKLAPKNIIYPLLSYVFLTPLNEFLKQAGYEPNFVYFLLGKTGTGKSTLSALFLSFFGDFSSTDLPLSFMDTANSIISKAFAMKDSLICIDDYKPSTRADVSKMDNTAQNILRSYSERTGRQRLKSDSTDMKQKYPRGNAIITGEQLPNVGESGTARNVISEIKRGDINFEMMSMAQNNARDGFYSSIMRSFIEWLQTNFLNENKDFFIETFRSDFEKSRRNWSDKLKNSVHPRIPSTLAFLKIGFKYFLEFCKFYNVLDKNLSDNRMNEFVDILIQMAEEHAKLSHEDKPIVKFINSIKDLMASETIYIRKIDSFPDENERGNLIGYLNEEFYYFIPAVLYKQVYEFCEKQGDHFSLSKNALFKQLAEEKLIITESNHNTVNRKIKGTEVRRFLCFPKNKFDNFESEP